MDFKFFINPRTIQPICHHYHYLGHCPGSCENIREEYRLSDDLSESGSLLRVHSHSDALSTLHSLTLPVSRPWVFPLIAAKILKGSGLCMMSSCGMSKCLFVKFSPLLEFSLCYGVVLPRNQATREHSFCRY